MRKYKKLLEEQVAWVWLGYVRLVTINSSGQSIYSFPHIDITLNTDEYTYVATKRAGGLSLCRVGEIDDHSF